MTTKENLLRAIYRNNPQWIPNGTEGQVTILPPVVERPKAAGFDSWGVEFVLEEEVEGGTYPKKDGHLIKDFANWRNEIKIPDVNNLDWNGMIEEYKVDKINRKEKLVTGFIEFGIFERSYMLLGMDNALINYIIEPDEMFELAKVIADYKIKLIEKFNKIIKLDMIWYGDDWGTQRKLFMHPDIWRKIIKPQTKRIYDCIKDLNIIVNQHSCGRIEEIFSDMVEMGADMWNPCQPCNNLGMLKKKFGDKISFFGGIDSQFVLDRSGATTDDVRAEVRKRIDEMGKGGGYIANPSHGVPYRKDIIDAMNDEINTYGRY